MFLKATTLLETINQEAMSVGDDSISPATFYRLRRVYKAVYPDSEKVFGTRIAYDDSVALFFYFCLRIHNRLNSYDLTRLYMQRLQRELKTQGKRFSEAFPNYSAINTHFLNEFIAVA